MSEVPAQTAERVSGYVKVLQTRTSFPAGKVPGAIDFPYPDFELDVEKQFAKTDSERYSATMTNSFKAALLRYSPTIKHRMR